MEDLVRRVSHRSPPYVSAISRLVLKPPTHLSLPPWTFHRCPSDDKHEGETAQQMQDRVDAVIAKVRSFHKEAEDRGCKADSELSNKEKREAAEECDTVSTAHSHHETLKLNRMLLQCIGHCQPWTLLQGVHCPVVRLSSRGRHQLFYRCRRT